ncbi:hypothetical protein GS481_02680 [Rhodococcus hoagii]|nr:hypothetical protein [Prescottella equi]
MSTTLLAAAHLGDGTPLVTALFWTAVYLLIPVVAAQFPATRYYASSGDLGDMSSGGIRWARLRRTDVSRPRLVAEILAAGAAATAGSLFLTHTVIENIHDVTASVPFVVLASFSAIPALAAIFYTALAFGSTNDQVQAAQSALLRTALGAPALRAGSNVSTRTEATR